MEQIAIGLGSNLGDRLHHLRSGVTALASLLGAAPSTVSCLYETDPVDCLEDLPFYNAVVCFETEAAAAHVLAMLQQVENLYGRTRPYPNAPRNLDLDLLFYGQSEIATPDLTIPHPRLQDRLFVLAPLCDCLGDSFRHPALADDLGNLTARARVAQGGDSVRRVRPQDWAPAVT